MIPKIIHYCWFGKNPLPKLAKDCIESWRKYLPEYEIKQWDESNFDVNIIPYTAEAYKHKKYAFVSDYARFWIIYKYGGIYFDTDVEVIRPMEKIISKGNFMGFEIDPDGKNTPGRYAPRFCFDVALGLGFGMTKAHPFMKRMMDYYQYLSFELPPTDITWYKTIVTYTTEQLCEMGLKNQKGIQKIEDITIYPHEYFAPIDVITGRLQLTKNTYTIHRYMGSWNAEQKTIKNIVRNIMPKWMFYFNNRIKRNKYKIK